MVDYDAILQEFLRNLSSPPPSNVTVQQDADHPTLLHFRVVVPPYWKFEAPHDDQEQTQDFGARTHEADG